MPYSLIKNLLVVLVIEFLGQIKVRVQDCSPGNCKKPTCHSPITPCQCSA